MLTERALERLLLTIPWPKDLARPNVALRPLAPCECHGIALVRVALWYTTGAISQFRSIAPEGALREAARAILVAHAELHLTELDPAAAKALERLTN